MIFVLGYFQGEHKSEFSRAYSYLAESGLLTDRDGELMVYDCCFFVAGFWIINLELVFT